MRLIKALVLATAALFLSAAIASATLQITTVGPTQVVPAEIGDVLQFDVSVTGTGDRLGSLFFSMQWDPTMFALQSAQVGAANRKIFPATFYYSSSYPNQFAGELSRVAAAFCAPGDDCNSTIRFVQYGNTSPGTAPTPAGYYYGRATATPETFRLKLTAIGGGISNVTAFVNSGDAISNLAGPVAANFTGSVVSVNPIPEPGTALLMGLGLVGLGVAGRRNR
jgi:hypothetical protein